MKMKRWIESKTTVCNDAEEIKLKLNLKSRIRID